MRAGPRGMLALGLALTSAGCMFHVDTSRNAPGIVDLAKRPTPLTAPTTPDDPGQRGVAFHGSVNAGGWANPHAYGGSFGAELGMFAAFTMAESGRSWLNYHSLDGFGAAIGWTMYRTEGDGQPKTFGPLYAEARAAVGLTKNWFGSTRFGLGVAFNPQALSAGPQASACIGAHPAFLYVCTRGSYMFGGEGPEFYLYLELASFLEVAWSR